MAAEWNIYDKCRDSAVPSVRTAKLNDHCDRWIRNIAGLQPSRDGYPYPRVFNNSICDDRHDFSIVALFRKAEEKASETANRILAVH